MLVIYIPTCALMSILWIFIARRVRRRWRNRAA